MKLLWILLALAGFSAVVVVSVNTLAHQKIIPNNPLVQLGAPTYTWQDVGNSITLFKPSATSPDQAGSWLTSTWNNLRSQLSQVGSRGQTATQHLQNIAGTKQLIGVAPTQSATISSDANTASSVVNPLNPGPTEPFYDKAIDYTRYLYCQEVIKEYEQQHPEMKPTGS